MRRERPAVGRAAHVAGRFIAEAHRVTARAPGGSEIILVAVNLDPHNAQQCDFEIPLWEFGLADHASVDVEDLVGGSRFTWTGKVQHLSLDPDRPYAIWRVTPPGGDA